MNDDNFEPTGDDELEGEGEPSLWPDEPEQAGPEKIDGEIDDADYRAESVPDTPDGYKLPDKVLESADYDENFANEAKKILHAERFSQNQVTKVVRWWEKNRTSFDIDDPESFVDSFRGFAKRNGVSEGQVANLAKWFGALVEKQLKQLAQIQENAYRVHRRPSSDGRVARIAQLRSSKAYTNKGTTPAERQAHRQAVEAMLKLTGAKK